MYAQKLAAGWLVLRTGQGEGGRREESCYLVDSVRVRCISPSILPPAHLSFSVRITGACETKNSLIKIADYIWEMHSQIYFLIFVSWLLLLRTTSENVDLTMAAPRRRNVCIHAQVYLVVGSRTLVFHLWNSETRTEHTAFLALQISKLPSQQKLWRGECNWFIDRYKPDVGLGCWDMQRFANTTGITNLHIVLCKGSKEKKTKLLRKFQYRKRLGQSV